ncbi:CRAL/TRIO domain [Popillia japonica]|uniref:CRAL/TRIO domain n=1 Tax=Popillia japonica TaxID=7064 RepID=A0AAW1HUK9_POPJA
MAAALTPEEEASTKKFLEIVNSRARRKSGPVSWTTAVRFLFACPPEIRAVALFEQHESIRRREGLTSFDPMKDPLLTELKTGKFTMLPTRDSTDAAIAVFTAHKHNPTTSTHQMTLQGVVYQLDVALQSPKTQKAGIVFIYDMTNSKYSNFDYDLSQKILTMLKRHVSSSELSTIDILGKTRTAWKQREKIQNRSVAAEPAFAESADAQNRSVAAEPAFAESADAPDRGKLASRRLPSFNRFSRRYAVKGPLVILALRYFCSCCCAFSPCNLVLGLF